MWPNSVFIGLNNSYYKKLYTVVLVVLNIVATKWGKQNFADFFLKFNILIVVVAWFYMKKKVFHVSGYYSFSERCSYFWNLQFRKLLSFALSLFYFVRNKTNILLEITEKNNFFLFWNWGIFASINLCCIVCEIEETWCIYFQTFFPFLPI